MAEATVSVSELQVGIWVCCALLLLNGLVNLAKLLKIIRNDPTQINATVEGQCARQADFDRALEHNRVEHENIFAKLGGLDRGLRAEVKKDTNELHEKINAVDRSVAGLNATNNIQNQRMSSMEGKIDKVLERLPRSNH